jgi:hypothetical protein
MLWAGALAAAALALSGGVLSVVTVSEVAHTDIVSTGLDVEGNVVLGAVGILLTVLSGWWGVRCEHLLRHRHPAIRRLTASQSLFRGWRRERHGPTSTALGLAVYVVFVGLMVPGVVSGYHDARHSSDTQHGGARRDGTIVKIVYVGQFGRSGIRYPNYLYSTSESMVELSSPVAGHRSTTLHYRSSSENPGMSFSVGNNMVGAGRVVQVLVDPKDPAYSEFRCSSCLLSHAFLWCCLQDRLPARCAAGWGARLPSIRTCPPRGGNETVSLAVVKGRTNSRGRDSRASSENA